MGKHITNNNKRVAHNEKELGLMFLETLISIWNEAAKKANKKANKKSNNNVDYSDEDTQVIMEQLANFLEQRIEQHDTLFDAWVDLTVIIIAEQKKYGIKGGWDVVVE